MKFWNAIYVWYRRNSRSRRKRIFNYLWARYTRVEYRKLGKYGNPMLSAAAAYANGTLKALGQLPPKTMLPHRE
jgi:hypothetical protein